MSRPPSEFAVDRPPAIGALLRIAWDHLRGQMYEGAAREGFDDLRPVHWAVIRYPPIDGLRPSELAARVNLSKQAINDVLRDLERLDYVRLEADPDDRRARVIRFTDRGWQLYEAGSRLSNDVGRRWADEIGAERYADFEATLREIAALCQRDRERPIAHPPA